MRIPLGDNSLNTDERLATGAGGLIDRMRGKNRNTEEKVRNTLHDQEEAGFDDLIGPNLGLNSRATGTKGQLGRGKGDGEDMDMEDEEDEALRNKEGGYD